MARVICGRCGHYTVDGSTYCAIDHWVLLDELPNAQQSNAKRVDFVLPEQHVGLFARRNQEKQRDNLERSYKQNLETRLEKWEKQLETDPDNASITRRMGLLALLEGQIERAGALFERARSLEPNDFESMVNHAVTLARRGRLQPAIDLLLKARQQKPDSPLVLFNLALVGLQARRPKQVYEAIDALEKLWQNNGAIAKDYHDDGVTLRGLALLLEGKPQEALLQLEAAARHRVDLGVTEAEMNNRRHAERRRGDRRQRDIPVENDRRQGPRRKSDRREEVELIEFLENGGFNEAGQSLGAAQISGTGEDAEIILPGQNAEADSLNNLALAEVALGQTDRAVARLRAALHLEPGHLQALNNLGVLALRQGDVAVAWRYLDALRQVEESTGSVEAVTWNHLGAAAAAQGDVEKSLEYYQRAGGTEHGEFEVYYNLGRSWIEHGKSDIGVPYLRQAFAIEPNNADVHAVLGAAYLFVGRADLYAEALKHLKRALQLDAHHRAAAVDLILALTEIHNNEVAGQLIGQAFKLAPKAAEPNFLAALMMLENAPDALEHEDRWAAAAQRFEVAVAARPNLVSALYNSALCQFMIGFRDSSAKLLDAVVARDPSVGPAYYLIGYGHAVAKRDDDAIKAWKIAAKYEPNNPDLYSNLGALLYRKKDYQGSIRAYAQAHRLLPDDAQILAALGVAFAQAKMYQQAILTIKQSIEIDPRSPIAYSNLGLAHYLFKEIEAAVLCWRMVVQLDSAYAERREGIQEKSFDETIIQLRPINWRNRVVRMAPVLPRAQTRLLPGTNAREYRLVVTDPELQHFVTDKRDMDRTSRQLASMNLKR